ncbi:hypothetical protein T484DRAFT_1846491 [Baffinella frigidus]|nr:hypothetical protein T484DRAFT_1846491 [Cryptophyta sp. CCMP2293]
MLPAGLRGQRSAVPLLALVAVALARIDGFVKSTEEYGTGEQRVLSSTDTNTDQLNHSDDYTSDLAEKVRTYLDTPGPQGATGMIGARGFPGRPGGFGPRGDTGPAGAGGDRGYMGEPGLQGVNAAMGPRGAAGKPGPVGVQGQQGRTGDGGLEGDEGGRGPQGHPGEEGLVGPHGRAVQGQPGPLGPHGPIGRFGAVGPEGFKGLHGMGGVSGPPGPVGPAGWVGVNGRRGPAGISGPPGTFGGVGRDTPSGPGGKVGVPGQAGVGGVQGGGGISGPSGVEGSAGVSGVHGAAGTAGAAGTPGLQGQDGQQGPVGGFGPNGPNGSGGANQPWGPAAWQRWRERGSWPGASGVGDWLWDGVQVATTAPVISLKGTGVAASTGGETLGGKTLPRKALSTLMRKLDADAETMQKLEPSIAKRLLTPAHLHARARSGGATPQRNTAMGSTARRISTVPTVPTVKVAGGLADVVEKTALARRRERRAVLKPTKAGKEALTKMARLTRLDAPLHAAPDHLSGGELLDQGTSLASDNGKYKLFMQTDGNLVYYEGDTAIWASGTNGEIICAKSEKRIQVHSASTRSGEAADARCLGPCG